MERGGGGGGKGMKGGSLEVLVRTLCHLAVAVPPGRQEQSSCLAWVAQRGCEGHCTACNGTHPDGRSA